MLKDNRWEWVERLFLWILPEHTPAVDSRTTVSALTTYVRGRHRKVPRKTPPPGCAAFRGRPTASCGQTAKQESEDPRADELVRILGQSDAVGESVLGTADTWPRAMYDAIGILKSEKHRDGSAQGRAINRAD